LQIPFVGTIQVLMLDDDEGTWVAQYSPSQYQNGEHDG